MIRKWFCEFLQSQKIICKIEANQQRFCKILSAVVCTHRKGVVITIKPQHPETFPQQTKMVLGKSLASQIKNNQPDGDGVWYWCCSHILCAAALHLVLQQCFSCYGIVLCAIAMLFVLWPCSLCHEMVLCATALCYVPQHLSSCHGNALCAVARK